MPPSGPSWARWHRARRNFRSLCLIRHPALQSQTSEVWAPYTSARTGRTYPTAYWMPSKLSFRSAGMAKVLLGVTGSVAAIYTPDLYKTLQKARHQVKVVATQAALYFFDPAMIDATEARKPTRNHEIVILDADEWPGRGEGQRYERSDK